MIECLLDHSIFLKPDRCLLMKFCYFICSVVPFEGTLQDLLKKVMVAKPFTLIIKGNTKKVGFYQLVDKEAPVTFRPT